MRSLVEMGADVAALEDAKTEGRGSGDWAGEAWELGTYQMVDRFALRW